MKKKLVSVLTIATLAVVSMSGCGTNASADSSSESSDTVTVGLLHSMTGSMAISE